MSSKVQKCHSLAVYQVCVTLNDLMVNEIHQVIHKSVITKVYVANRGQN